MPISREQIESFHHFAVQQLEAGGADTTIDELFDAWRARNPTPEEVAENVAAVNASIEDFEKGKRGRLAGTLVRELRQQLDRSKA